LSIRQVETHVIEAQNPDFQGLVVTFKYSTCQVVKISPAVFAVKALAVRLRLVSPMLNDMKATAGRAAHALGPSEFPYKFKALHIINKAVNPDNALCTLISITIHELSSQNRGAHAIHAENWVMSRIICSRKRARHQPGIHQEPKVFGVHCMY
jgi:hypothetical protein